MNTTPAPHEHVGYKNEGKELGKQLSMRKQQKIPTRHRLQKAKQTWGGNQEKSCPTKS